MASLGLNLGGEKISRAILVFGWELVHGSTVPWALGVREHALSKIRHATTLNQARGIDQKNFVQIQDSWTDWIGHRTDPIGPIWDLASRVGSMCLFDPLYCRMKSYFPQLLFYLFISERQWERDIFPLFFILPPSSSLLPSHPWEEKIK
jgi:hypothetical protein